MPPFQEESSLREAIRTTLLQLCKVGVSYQTELSIEGTIGVTVDRQQVILVHFKECVENLRNVEQQNVYQPPTTNQLPEPARNTVVSATSTPVQNTVAHPNQVPLVNSPARIARQLLRDPMMGINISPRLNVGRNVRFDNIQNIQTPNQLPMTPSSLLPNDPGFPDSLLNDSLLMGRLPPNELDSDGPKPGNHTISIDLDSDESIEEEAFEFINKLGEMKTLKKEKVIKKIKRKSKKDAKSVIVIDDQGSEGGIDSATANLQAPPPPPPPPDPNVLTVENLSSPPHSTPISMDDFPAADLLSSPIYSQTSPTLSAPVSMAATADLVDIKMSIANMGNNIVKGDISTTADEQSTIRTTAEAEPSTVIGHIVKTSALEPNATIQGATPARPSSRSRSMVNLLCEICSKPQKSTGMLESHLVDFHGITKSSVLGNITYVSCDKCNKKFKHQASLDKHRISHITNKPHKCQQCDRSYRHRESLSIHASVHAGKLECQLCQKLYTSRIHFEKHISYMHETRRTIKGAKGKNN